MGGDEPLYVALLDLFGFEAFEHNTFSQFVINYVSERAQAYYVAATFAAELAVYEAEGLEVGPGPGERVSLTTAWEPV